MSIRRKWFFIAPAAIVAVTLFAFLGGEIVKLLWNWLLPPLFGLPSVTFWQALGLLALSRILFGGCKLGGGGRHAKWDRMSPEERERFRQRLRDRCGLGPSAAQDGGVA